MPISFILSHLGSDNMIRHQEKWLIEMCLPRNYKIQFSRYILRRQPELHTVLEKCTECCLHLIYNVFSRQKGTEDRPQVAMPIFCKKNPSKGSI